MSGMGLIVTLIVGAIAGWLAGVGAKARPQALLVHCYAWQMPMDTPAALPLLRRLTLAVGLVLADHAAHGGGRQDAAAADHAGLSARPRPHRCPGAYLASGHVAQQYLTWPR